MNTPNSVIYVVGDVLGSWYYSHSKLDTLFGGNGFPGDPPVGNCVTKCQEWLRRINGTSDSDPLDLLGRVLVEFMNLERDDDPHWQKARQRVTDVLQKTATSSRSMGTSLPYQLPQRQNPRFRHQRLAT